MSGFMPSSGGGPWTRTFCPSAVMACRQLARRSVASEKRTSVTSASTGLGRPRMVRRSLSYGQRHENFRAFRATADGYSHLQRTSGYGTPASLVHANPGHFDTRANPPVVFPEKPSPSAPRQRAYQVGAE